MLSAIDLMGRVNWHGRSPDLAEVSDALAIGLGTPLTK